MKGSKTKYTEEVIYNHRSCYSVNLCPSPNWVFFKRFFFFLIWFIFKAFIEFFTILLLFLCLFVCFFLATRHADLGYQTTDGTRTPIIVRWSVNHGPVGKSWVFFFFFSCFRSDSLCSILKTYISLKRLLGGVSSLLHSPSVSCKVWCVLGGSAVCSFPHQPQLHLGSLSYTGGMWSLDL